MYIIHLGVSGYPSNSAPIQRIRLTLKGLKLAGFYPLVINKQSMGTKKYPRIKLMEGIPVIFTSAKTDRLQNFIFRNFNKLSGIYGEIVLLVKKRKKIHTSILYTPSFGELVYYRIISKLLGFKMIVQYVELRSSIPERSSFSQKINDSLFDNHFNKFCDGVIAISDFLVKHVSEKSSNLPLIKIPAMCDFDEFRNIVPFKNNNYLMYCGSIAYSNVIEFIIDVFLGLKESGKYEGDLIMVISGDHPENWNKIKSKIKDAVFGSHIVIKSNIPYNELLSLYKGSKLLMIPLRNTIQDTARFPHKIGEYTASGRPILSTNLGELKIYFRDGVSAILTEEYSVAAYIDKLSALVKDNERLNDIGRNGFTIGMNNFDYRAQTLQLKKFIIDL